MSLHLKSYQLHFTKLSKKLFTHPSIICIPLPNNAQTPPTKKQLRHDCVQDNGRRGAVSEAPTCG